MLAKNNRFHGHNSLNYVYRRGRTVRSPLCAMRYIVKKDGNFRVAVVVSKKVSKSAAKRNRIRRRIYEAIRLLAPTYLKNQDIVVTVFDDRIVSLPQPELIHTLERQLATLSRTDTY